VQGAIVNIVYTATHHWYEIVSARGEVVLDEGHWDDEAIRAARIAGIKIDDADSWVCRVVGDTGRHTAIRAGDYACSDGYGCDVIFVR
jgi:hypothetical protein